MSRTGRKGIEVETRGLAMPRERVWAAVRRLRTQFSRASVQEACEPMVLMSTVRTYFDELLRAGYIVRVAKGKPLGGAARDSDTYDLVKDQYEAPRLHRGKVSTSGIGVLAVWRAMHLLHDFDYQQLTAAASHGDCVVRPHTTQSYMSELLKAGYLLRVRVGTPGKPGRYRLIRYTGPHPPAITRRKCVFDRNTGQFFDLESPQEVCDALE